MDVEAPETRRWIWLVAAVVFTVGEIAVAGTFFLAPFAAGAAVAAVVAFAGGPTTSGAIAAMTERIRIGYGVSLMPQPYDHAVRTAEWVAVPDLISNGRVDFGTGRSSTRADLEGFGVDPHETRDMWREAIEHVVGIWTHDEYELAARTGRCRGDGSSKRSCRNRCRSPCSSTAPAGTPFLSPQTRRSAGLR